MKSVWNKYISHDALVALTDPQTAPARSGKMAALLLKEFEGSELSKLPKTLQNKVEKILSDQQYEIDSLKAQQEQLRVDSGKLLSAIFLARGAKVCGFAQHAGVLVNGAQLNAFKVWTY